MDFVQFIVEMAAVVGGLTPFVNILVKASEGFGLSGKKQLAFALLTGGGLNALAFVAFNGVPNSMLSGFFMLLQVLAGAGTPVGFYNAVLKKEE